MWLSEPCEAGACSPEDVAEEQGRVVPEGPVVVERVDGGGQRLQDAVHDTGDQASHVGSQIQVGVLDQALHHVEEPVELLQVVAYRLHLHRNSPTINPFSLCVHCIHLLRENHINWTFPTVPICLDRDVAVGQTYPADDVNKVRQEGSDLGVGLEVQQSHLKHAEAKRLEQTHSFTGLTQMQQQLTFMRWGSSPRMARVICW